MATITTGREDLFPAGTLVSAYRALASGPPSSGAPVGAVIDSATVQADGTLTMDDLGSGVTYVLYAPSPDRYLLVNTSVAQNAKKGFVFWQSGGVPERPSGYGSVEWIGPDDPDDSAVNGDTWVNTA